MTSFSDYLLKRRCESVKNIRLMRALLPEIASRVYLEVGCAINELPSYPRLVLRLVRAWRRGG